MYVSDSSSNDAAYRQRRLAAEQKARVDKAYTEGAVRDGAVRQSGESPGPEEVDRFRALMQRGAERMPTKPGAQAAASTPARGEASNAPANAQAPTGPQTAADRFREMMLRAFAPDAGRSDEPSGEAMPKANGDPANEHPVVRADSSHTDSPRADARTATAQPTAEREPMPSSTPMLAQAGDEHGKQTTSAQASNAGDAPKQTNDEHDPADVAQAAAHKAARGEGHVAAAARRSLGDQESGAGAGGGDKSMTMSLTPPQMLQADSSGVPMQPQRAHADTAPQATPAGVVAQGLAELVQKHVKQMLVSDARGQRNGSREVLLRMQNDILPGTDLWLTRTDSGWSLRADVRSRDAYDTLLANQDDLVERFALSSLGALSIEPVFHGDSDAQRGLASAAPRPRVGTRDEDDDRERDRQR